MPKMRQLRAVGADYLDTAPVHGTIEHDIPASADVTFRALEDAESWPEFIGPITEVIWTSPPPFGVGTTRTIKGRGTSIDEEFWGWEDGRSMGFCFAAANVPVFAAFAEEWRVEPTGDDSCRLVWRYAFETPRLALPLQPVLGVGFKRQGAGFLRDLAEYMATNKAKYSA
ncbi:MAG: SRPBCC family protein [Actinomycetota bacterium]